MKRICALLVVAGFMSMMLTACGGDNVSIMLNDAPADSLYVYKCFIEENPNPDAGYAFAYIDEDDMPEMAVVGVKDGVPSEEKRIFYDDEGRISSVRKWTDERLLEETGYGPDGWIYVADYEYRDDGSLEGAR